MSGRQLLKFQTSAAPTLAQLGKDHDFVGTGLIPNPLVFRKLILHGSGVYPQPPDLLGLIL
jgi:hypothetical protein